MSATTLSNSHSVAVLLNPNARWVDRKLAQRVQELVDPADVFISDDPRKAQEITAEIARRGYETVFTGGGDGTATNFINAQYERGNSAARVGILKLGAGNAMSEIVSSGDAVSDLRQFVANPSNDTTPLALCEAEGTRFAFAAMGLDAQILSDYRKLHAKMGRAVENRLGYFAAAVGGTMPRMLADWFKGRKIDVRVVNTGGDAYAINPDGRGNGTVGEAFGEGEVLYEGPMNRAVFGTCPFYGYRLRALPFAGIESKRFHLRIGAVGASKMLVGLRSLWRGTLRHPDLHDFHVQSVSLTFSEPVPYQMAGEGMGMREHIQVGMATRPVELVRFF